MKKQIQKQLKFASKLLQEISREHKKGNYYRFGYLAYDVQLKEYERLKALYEKHR